MATYTIKGGKVYSTATGKEVSAKEKTKGKTKTAGYKLITSGGTTQAYAESLIEAKKKGEPAPVLVEIKSTPEKITESGQVVSKGQEAAYIVSGVDRPASSEQIAHEVVRQTQAPSQAPTPTPTISRPTPMEKMFPETRGQQTQATRIGSLQESQAQERQMMLQEIARPKTTSERLYEQAEKRASAGRYEQPTFASRKEAEKAQAQRMLSTPTFAAAGLASFAESNVELGQEIKGKILDERNPLAAFETIGKSVVSTGKWGVTQVLPSRISGLGTGEVERRGWMSGLASLGGMMAGGYLLGKVGGKVGGRVIKETSIPFKATMPKIVEKMPEGLKSPMFRVVKSAKELVAPKIDILQRGRAVGWSERLAPSEMTRGSAIGKGKAVISYPKTFGLRRGTRRVSYNVAAEQVSIPKEQIITVTKDTKISGIPATIGKEVKTTGIAYGSAVVRTLDIEAKKTLPIETPAKFKSDIIKAKPKDTFRAETTFDILKKKGRQYVETGETIKSKAGIKRLTEIRDYPSNIRKETFISIQRSKQFPKRTGYGMERTDIFSELKETKPKTIELGGTKIKQKQAMSIPPPNMAKLVEKSLMDYGKTLAKEQLGKDISMLRDAGSVLAAKKPQLLQTTQKAGYQTKASTQFVEKGGAMRLAKVKMEEPAQRISYPARVEYPQTRARAMTRTMQAQEQAMRQEQSMLSKSFEKTMQEQRLNEKTALGIASGQAEAQAVSQRMKSQQALKTKQATKQAQRVQAQRVPLRTMIPIKIQTHIPIPIPLSSTTTRQQRAFGFSMPNAFKVLFKGDGKRTISQKAFASPREAWAYGRRAKWRFGASMFGIIPTESEKLSRVKPMRIKIKKFGEWFK